MLSIIVPTYNSDKTIKKCLNSAINLRKYNIDFEVILVDDGSSDGTRLINNHYANKYNNIIALTQNHEGVSIARNLGLSRASGSWVCFLDSDDTLNAYNLADVYNHYAKLNNDIIISNINRNNKLIGVNNEITSNVKSFVNKNYPIYKKFTIMDLSGKIYNLDLIKKFNINFPPHITIGEDFIFTMRFLRRINNKKVIQTPISYYNYYVNNGSSVMNYDRQSIKNRMKIFYTIKSMYKQFDLSLKALNWIKIEIVYSILLNDLRLPSNKFNALLKDKKKIYQLKLLPNRKYMYNKIECSLLEFIVSQPSILTLYIILKCIDFVRKI